MKKNEIFKFKQFDVAHQINAQKVSTDSVLLGAWADLEKSENILDIGTGCGVLSLMAAQRNLNAEIIAIEIENSFAEEAEVNFKNSRFSSRINLINEDVRDYSSTKFDHIICNPPYFSDSLKSDIISRNKARHDLNLSFDSLAESSSKLLNDNGRISLVIPFEKKDEVVKSFSTFELYLSRSYMVKHTLRSKYSLCLLEFQNERIEFIESSELIIKSDNEFSFEYKNLLSEFLLIF